MYLIEDEGIEFEVELDDDKLTETTDADISEVLASRVYDALSSEALRMRDDK